jgi:alkanesulfonate monooxygenase SsuD/methylene tetrahydromethanopterin reductase-like flavin-dependent oxidoreductase (luciferase family)
MGIKIGLTLPNRGVLLGATTPAELVDLAEIADKSGAFESVWVGDSLLAKPRLESITLLSAIASRTSQVKLGPACMASFPLRDPILLADQWASLDQLAGGRTILVACNGNVVQAGVNVELDYYGVTPSTRVGRVTEGVQILRKLWGEDDVSFQGKHFSFENVSIAPKPVHGADTPIWLAVHPPADRPDLIEKAHNRIVKYADGWQTSKWQHDDLAWRIDDLKSKAAEAGKDVFTHLYHNVNLTDDLAAATDESKKFLDAYYTMDYPEPFVQGWTSQGTAEQVIERIKSYEAIGFDGITLRITSWNQREQLARLIEEVLPHFPDSAGSAVAEEATVAD